MYKGVEKANSCGSISVNLLAGKQIRAGVVAMTLVCVCVEETEFTWVLLNICVTSPLKAMMKVVALTKVLMTAFLLQISKDNISEIIASEN